MQSVISSANDLLEIINLDEAGWQRIFTWITKAEDGYV